MEKGAPRLAAPGGVGDTGPGQGLPSCFHPGNLHMCGTWHRDKAARRTTQRPGYRSTGRLERGQKHAVTVRQRVCLQSIPSILPVRSNPLKTQPVSSDTVGLNQQSIVTANPTNRKLSNTFLNYSGSTSVETEQHTFKQVSERGSHQENKIPSDKGE